MKPGSDRTYTTASKQEVRAEGEKVLMCGFMSGSELQTTWEVGDFNRPLSAVSKMVRGGHRVWFDTEANGGSGIYSYETKKTMKIFEREGIYVLPAWIRSGTSISSSAPGNQDTGFSGQGSRP